MRTFVGIAYRAAAVFFIASVLLVLLYRVVNPPVTILMLKRTMMQAVEGHELRLQKQWKSLDEISPYVVQAVVSSEDNNFPIHRGIDPDAIRKARQINKNSGRLHGASTISQQTAKNVFLWPRRSFIRKGFELYFTALIEVFWSKRRIMEVYLNVIEMGNGIYGVEAASQVYFHKPAANLIMREAALLASILPAPRKRNPARPTEYLSNRTDYIINLMYKVGKVEL